MKQLALSASALALALASGSASAWWCAAPDNQTQQTMVEQARAAAEQQAKSWAAWQEAQRQAAEQWSQQLADAQTSAAPFDNAPYGYGWPVFGPVPPFGEPPLWAAVPPLPEPPALPEFSPMLTEVPAFGERPEIPGLPALPEPPAVPDLNKLLTEVPAFGEPPNLPGLPALLQPPVFGLTAPDLPEPPAIPATPASLTERLAELDRYRDEARKDLDARREAMKQWQAQRTLARRMYNEWRHPHLGAHRGWWGYPVGCGTAPAAPAAPTQQPAPQAELPANAPTAAQVK